MKKTTMGFVTGVSVLGAIVIGLGAVSSWFTNWNIKTWFGRGGGTITQPNKDDMSKDKEKSSDGAIIADGESNGIRVMTAKLPRAAYKANGISEQADTAYILTATVEPASATDKTVDWAVEWVNSDSDWASEKTVTDYVTVTPVSDGALTATVECKQAFGEQVKVLCISRDNSALSAVCMVDYTQKILSANIAWQYYFGGPTEYFPNGNVSTFCFAGNDSAGGYLGGEINTTACTIQDDYQISVNVEAASEFMEALSFGTAGSMVLSCSDDTLGNSSLQSLFDDYGLNKLFGANVCRSARFHDLLGQDDFKNTYGCVKTTVTVTGEYSSYSYTGRVIFGQNAISVSATNVTLNTSSIIF